ncbi:hypothetical protein B296_00015742 [Ensete ventricosum]|uniref:Uncharacterized protein n=1 Tax=Ensete ventricosum TaxID=4639 RepID=A0A426Z7D3_ENSVE|nr:hypothetical protein B296_00015742 [Ensete ventricosum]
MMSATCNPDAISLNQVEDMGGRHGSALCSRARIHHPATPFDAEKNTAFSTCRPPVLHFLEPSGTGPDAPARCSGHGRKEEKTLKEDWWLGSKASTSLSKSHHE